MENPDSGTPNEDIAHLTSTCLALFQDLLKALGRDDSCVPEQTVDRTRLQEEFGRLKIWCDENEPESLGRLLLHEEKLKIGIQDTLTVMIDFLNLTLSLCSDGPGNSGSIQQQAELNTDEPATVDYHEVSEKRDDQSVTLMPTYMNHIFSKVDLLFRFNTLLHRAEFRTRYLKSTALLNPRATTLVSEKSENSQSLANPSQKSESKEQHGADTQNPAGHSESKTIGQSSHYQRPPLQSDEGSINIILEDVHDNILPKCEQLATNSSYRAIFSSEAKELRTKSEGLLLRLRGLPVNQDAAVEQSRRLGITRLVDVLPRLGSVLPEVAMRQAETKPIGSEVPGSDQSSDRISKSMRNLKLGSSQWRWNCCNCGTGNLSYSFDIACTSCYHRRDGGCNVWATGK
ncbi:hypothetical protein HD806DRAFT_501174 [Xylariaceae sp. AK1471]|nr:hypothetical protein HD806DRAFT_501174 [Xylariaceae sp. AK1471]